jgi:phosphoglycolate phosphatase-like HAD superfamily hydrolase
LDRHGLADLFAYVIGRNVPRQKWQAMENKTQQFLRVSNIIGVPLERMIFVGDSDADYKSAAQIGLNFVESRYNAQRHGRTSLVNSLDPKGRPFLLGKKGELLTAIQAIEARLEHT